MTTPQVLGERYEIGEVLGCGGMAEVHRGRDLRLGREVAVKVLRSDLARDPSFQVRFRREAQAAASLNHPAIVAVYDTGEDRTRHRRDALHRHGVRRGRDAARRAAARGPADPERAMEIAADVCAALDFSHRNGIVHRDIKPGNVMITPQGAVKVMDFGIARAVSDSAATMTSDRRRHRHRAVPLAGAGPRRGRRRPLRRLLRSAACSTSWSPARRRSPATPRSRSPTSTCARTRGCRRRSTRRPAGARRDRAQGDEQEPGQPVPVGRRDAHRPAPGARRAAGRGHAGHGRRREDDDPRRGARRRTATADAGDRWADEDEDADRQRRRRRLVVIGGVVALLLIAGAVARARSLLNRGPSTPVAAAQVAVPNVVGPGPGDRHRRRCRPPGLTVGTVTPVASTAAAEGPGRQHRPGRRGAGGQGPAGRPGRRRRAGHDHRARRRSGQTDAAATAALKQAGFTGSINTEQVDSLVAEGARSSEIDPAEGLAGRRRAARSRCRCPPAPSRCPT